jgi:hypothetical protein
MYPNFFEDYENKRRKHPLIKQIIFSLENQPKKTEETYGNSYKKPGT